jgi:hypothetical protein
MQDLLIGAPFIAVGLTVIVIAMVFARQTTLSGRRLDEAMKMMPQSATLPMQVAGTATSQGADVEGSQATYTH